jgi:hypothetical protein
MKAATALLPGGLRGDAVHRAVEGLGDKRQTASRSSVAWVVCFADELTERWWAIAARKERVTEV